VSFCTSSIEHLLRCKFTRWERRKAILRSLSLIKYDSAELENNACLKEAILLLCETNEIQRANIVNFIDGLPFGLTGALTYQPII